VPSRRRRRLAACKQINDLPTRARSPPSGPSSNELGGGCLAAVGALCGLTGVGALELIGLVGDPGRRRIMRLSAEGPYKDPEAVGRRLAEDVRAAMGA
jgi:hydroxymethylbilane synthase